MRYRTFGRTGLQVSELVFGGGWVGGVLIHQDDQTKLATLRRALDAGINWIDTAPSYGNPVGAGTGVVARGDRHRAAPVHQGAA
jgi:aryl-alcohol dehydrogenase-like predicted oxidoreductase